VSAISCLRLAIEIFTDEGRFTQAAKHTKEIAELYESEMDYENAVTYFQVGGFGPIPSHNPPGSWGVVRLDSALFFGVWFRYSAMFFFFFFFFFGIFAFMEEQRSTYH
jgi:hypothetical protein